MASACIVRCSPHHRCVLYKRKAPHHVFPPSLRNSIRFGLSPSWHFRCGREEMGSLDYLEQRVSHGGHQQGAGASRAPVRRVVGSPRYHKSKFKKKRLTLIEYTNLRLPRTATPHKGVQ
ncbi:hypothetical protein NL676_007122 [Syzygium grande]|nr:hypothetical protein NL676_007122 [Syzygium grande]